MPEAGRNCPDSRRALSVLVVEDHPINQRLTMEILLDGGHSFVIANNGIEALKLLEQHSFDVILMDGQMPEMDGYQTAREIRRREQGSGQRVAHCRADGTRDERRPGNLPGRRHGRLPVQAGESRSFAGDAGTRGH